jgi:hypothetical protein
MPLIVPDAGEVRLLEYIVNKRPATNLVLRLYTNDKDLSDETFVTSDFVEVTTAGYAAASLIGSNWDVSTNSGISVAVYNTAITFSFSAGVNVMGYYVTDNSNPTPPQKPPILWAERFPGAPFTLPSTGGEISIRPQIQLN